MDYTLRRTIKDNRLMGAIAYNIKHGILPEARVAARMKRIERIAAGGDYDRERISGFRNTHLDESCFVIGNGPSVSVEDLDRIQASGLCSFGANRISDLFPRTTWRPTFMCAMEHGFLGKLDGAETIDGYLANLRANGIQDAFVNEEFRNQISTRAARSTAVFVRCPLAPLYTTALMPFSEDAALYVSDLGSVTHFAIQIACYMGFNRIYLYGVDNAYGKYLGMDGTFHVVERAESHAFGIEAVRDDATANDVPRSNAEAYSLGGFADMRKSEIGYRMCEAFAREHDLEIINVTRGGRLEIFRRLDFETALGGGFSNE